MPSCWSTRTAFASVRARLKRDVRALDTTEPVEEAPDAKPAEIR
jgi:predicted DsbA family dithiol-disulfide isomerase